MKNNCFLAFAAFVLSLPCIGQTPAEDLTRLEAKYQDEMFVNTSQIQQATIEIKKGELLINEFHENEAFYLNDDVSRFSRESVPFGFFTEIDDLEAHSSIPGSKKYETRKVSRFYTKDEFTAGIFKDDRKSISFRYSGLVKGAKSHYSYTEKVKNPRFLGGFYFVSGVPTEHMEYSITVDDGVSIGWEEFNMEAIDVSFTETKSKGTTTYKWVLKNLPAVAFEEESPDMRYWVPHILPYIKTWSNGSSEQEVLGSVDALFSWYNDLIDEMEPSDQAELKVIVDSIVAGASSDRDKVEKIFKWTQGNIKYVAVENGLGGFIPRPGSAVCSKRYGDCKDMASIITEMTSIAGVETNLTWIGSRDIPYKYTELATPSVDNHMIAAYKDGDEWLFLDATGSHEYFGQPTSFIQGKEALIRLSDSKYEIVEVPIAKANENERTVKAQWNVSDGTLKGEASAVLTGYYASAMKGLLERLDAEEKEEYFDLYFKQGNNKCKLENVEYTAHDDENKLEFSFDLTLPDYVLNVDDELIVNLNLDKPYSGYAVDKERTQPRTFRFESLVAFETSFLIPEGYEIEFLPQNSSGTSNGISFDISYKIEDDNILYNATFNLSTLMLNPDGFEEWNALIKSLKKELKNALVLKKKKI